MEIMIKAEGQTQAYIKEDENGRLVLVDPMAYAMIQAIEKVNCRNTLETQIDRVEHFIGRMKARNLTAADVVIVLINVDTPLGAPLADILMPGHNWDEYRSQGQVPFARGLVVRDGIQDILNDLDALAADKLKEMKDTAVVVVDYGVVEVFSA